VREGANTVFERQEIGQRKKRDNRENTADRERRDIEIKTPKEISQQITEKRSKDRSETRHQRVITQCNQRL
jgi:hypothetical protein